MGKREKAAPLVGEHVRDGALVLDRMRPPVRDVVEEAGERPIAFVDAEDPTTREEPVAQR